MEPNVGALIYLLKQVTLIAYFVIFTLVTLFMPWIDSKLSTPSRKCDEVFYFKLCEVMLRYLGRGLYCGNDIATCFWSGLMQLHQ
jgi:hypothetical protein